MQNIFYGSKDSNQSSDKNAYLQTLSDNNDQKIMFSVKLITIMMNSIVLVKFFANKTPNIQCAGVSIMHQRKSFNLKKNLGYCQRNVVGGLNISWRKSHAKSYTDVNTFYQQGWEYTDCILCSEVKKHWLNPLQWGKKKHWLYPLQWGKETLTVSSAVR